MEFLPWALHYIALGWPVFPLVPGAKEPVISSKEGGRGCHDGTLDSKRIEVWARRWPDANIGITCGKKAAILVLDIDVKDGAPGLVSIKALEKAGKAFPKTVMARTPSGGWHAYFGYVDGPGNSKSRLAKGLDIRTEGGYVVAPPSFLVEHNRAYSWVRRPLGGCLPKFPHWAVQALKPREETPFYFERVGIPGDIEPLVRKITEMGLGERNSILYWCAMRGAEMVKRGEIAPADVASALRGAAQMQGLGLKEADKTIGSAFNRVFGGRR